MFRHFKDIIDLNTLVPDGPLKFCMAEQELDCPQVLRPAVEKGCVRTLPRVGAVHGRIQANVPAVEVAGSHFKLPFGVSLSFLAQV
jgi:hypothetical protein